MSDMLEDRLDMVLPMQQRRRRQHGDCARTDCEAHAGLERIQAKFCTEVRPLIEHVVARVNRHLAKRLEKCRLAEISGYFTGPLYPGGSACNPLAYELRIDGQGVGETLLVELTHQGMIEAALGPFRRTVSEGHTIRRYFGWAPVPLDKFDASIASDLVVRYITVLTARWPGLNEGMVTTCNMQALAPPRSSTDLIAEGMWKVGAGKFCHESWIMLPERQKAWWRTCATECVRRWMAEIAGACY
jgi:hypothetical protein